MVEKYRVIPKINDAEDIFIFFIFVCPYVGTKTKLNKQSESNLKKVKNFRIKARFFQITFRLHLYIICHKLFLTGENSAYFVG